MPQSARETVIQGDPSSEVAVQAKHTSAVDTTGSRWMRDNGVVYAPTGFVNQAQLAQSVDAAIRSLNPQEVVHVAYSIGHDSTDDPAIFFRTVLTDAASREESLADVTGRVASTLFNSIRPIENWGLTPYFSFRSFSEQRNRNDREWS